jgi:hypothetical protein
VHLTETHQLYDPVRGTGGRAPAPRPAARPGRDRLRLPRLVDPEPDIRTLLRITPDPIGGRSHRGAYVAVGAGLCLILAAFVPY